MSTPCACTPNSATSTLQHQCISSMQIWVRRRGPRVVQFIKKIYLQHVTHHSRFVFSSSDVCCFDCQDITLICWWIIQHQKYMFNRSWIGLRHKNNLIKPERLYKFLPDVVRGLLHNYIILYISSLLTCCEDDAGCKSHYCTAHVHQGLTHIPVT